MGDKKQKAKKGKKKPESQADEQTVAKEGPEVGSGAETVQRARDRIRSAQTYYRQLRKQAEEKADQLRGMTMGDAVDRVLETTRKHPVPCLLTAGVLGYFLGRLLRR